jgi:phosphopantetheinyl transferase (holo-ACP synthase)
VIGNDIVDLSFAQKESNWKRSCFLDKIFTQKEQKYIYASQQPEMMVWLLWSMKESAYKLHVQLHKLRFFGPKRFECFLQYFDESQSIGMVYFNDFQCFTQSNISSEFVYTISKLERNKDSLSQTFRIKNSRYQTQHEEVYQKAIARFAEVSGTTIQQISINKNDVGIPFFYSKKQRENFAVSITHHGNYGAYAINKP